MGGFNGGSPKSRRSSRSCSTIDKLSKLETLQILNEVEVDVDFQSIRERTEVLSSTLPTRPC